MQGAGPIAGAPHARPRYYPSSGLIGRPSKITEVDVTSSRGLLRAYIDETGDRGIQPSSSPFFAFAAVVVADEAEPGLRAVMSSLRRDLKVPTGKALHWNQHVKTHARRQHVAGSMAQLSDMQLIYVIVEKAAIPASAEMRRDHAIFYNYAAGIVMERILLTAGNWPGGARNVVTRFGHVRGFNHRKTESYFQIKEAQAPSWVPWRLISGRVHFDDQAAWDGLQAADQYAGMLWAALRQDEFGGYDEAHLLRVRHLIRRDAQGRSRNYGFKILGNEATFTSLPWWPAEGL
ncbi:DUF3800 domain-containing protein [Streptomyces lavendulocolor]|uniref:DUF3800 domain-containing protein n=1 Tax=Streptomyces lavendulocolor TaxID=67316 RepID=UPI003C2FFDE0